MLKKWGILLMLVVLAVGCGTKKSDVSSEKRLVVAQGADAKSLDPHGTNDQPSSRVFKQLYDRLVEVDEDMNIVPGLAVSWDHIDEVTTVFNLREGVKFHNGEELKAADVVFSLNRMMTSPQVSHIVNFLDEVEAVDDYKVKVTTKTPFGALLYHLAHSASSVLNEKAVKAAGGDYGQNPVGTGPFKFNNWVAGDSITMDAYEDYFRGKAKMDEVVFRNIIEGTNRVIGLETGEIDIAYGIEPIDTSSVQNHEDLVLEERESLAMEYIGFNMTKEPFNDERIRQAISYAINKDDIIESALLKAGAAANSPLPPKVFGYSKDAKLYEHNLEKARELMKEAGYEDGFETEIWTNDNPVRLQISQIVQAQLKEIGINMDVVPMEWGAYLDGSARGEHEMYILGWVTNTGDADYGLYAQFHSSSLGSAGNRSFYKNEEVDRLLDSGRASVDNAARIETYSKVQEILQDEAPVAPLYYKLDNVGMQKNIKGLILHPSGEHMLRTVSKDA